MMKKVPLFIIAIQAMALFVFLSMQVSIMRSLEEIGTDASQDKNQMAQQEVLVKETDWINMELNRYHQGEGNSNEPKRLETEINAEAQNHNNVVETNDDAMRQYHLVDEQTLSLADDIDVDQPWAVPEKYLPDKTRGGVKMSLPNYSDVIEGYLEEDRELNWAMMELKRYHQQRGRLPLRSDRPIPQQEGDDGQYEDEESDIVEINTSGLPLMTPATMSRFSFDGRVLSFHRQLFAEDTFRVLAVRRNFVKSAYLMNRL